MDCHIEIFHENQWLEAAQVSFSDAVRNGFRSDDCVFEYDLDYAFSDVPPVSLAFPLNADRHCMQAWPAFLYDLVPQGNGRRFLLDRMQLPDAQSSNLPLLCAGAFNPIGRLRIREAVTYFAEHRERHDLVNRGFDFDELLARAPEFHETMMVHGMLAAGGTGVQGVAPKYLLTQAQDGKWFPDAALHDDRARRHFIVSAQANQFKLLAAIRAVVDDPIAETIEFIQRDILNLAMRNPDNHARNTAVQTVDGATGMTPLFDFAPMYLDPEGITRAARWYHSGTGKELQRWDDVLAHLALPTLQHERLVEALLGFGARLATLADAMREAGIDADIVDFVTPSVDAQRTQLLALRP